MVQKYSCALEESSLSNGRVELLNWLSHYFWITSPWRKAHYDNPGLKF